MIATTFEPLYNTLTKLPELPPADQIRSYIILGFSALVGIAFLVSLIAMIIFKLRNGDADISIWLNVFLTCLGYVVGILSGLLGLPVPTPPSGGGH